MDNFVCLLNFNALVFNTSASAVTFNNFIVNGNRDRGLVTGNIITISGMMEFNNNKLAFDIQANAKTYGTIDSVCFNVTGFYIRTINNIVFSEIIKFNFNQKAMEATTTAFKAKFEKNR